MKKENLPVKEKRKIAKKLRKDFAKHVVPIAILIKNECEMDY